MATRKSFKFAPHFRCLSSLSLCTSPAPFVALLLEHLSHLSASHASSLTGIGRKSDFAGMRPPKMITKDGKIRHSLMPWNKGKARESKIPKLRKSFGGKKDAGKKSSSSSSTLSSSTSSSSSSSSSSSKNCHEDCDSLC